MTDFVLYVQTDDFKTYHLWLEVTFVTEPAYRKTIEEIDATFVPFYNYADFAEVDILTRWPLRETFLKGPLKPAFDLEEVFIETIPLN
jgi:hypothetical protein